MKKAYSYIRFSTPDQLKGDSLRRQLSASRCWADKNGYELDDSLKDFGVSARKGENRTEGALKIFLDRIQNGQIPKGSVLVVESLDRLSRDEITKSLSLFIEILNADIKIVTMADNQEYTRDSINNIGNLVISLVVMSRAYEESAIKSKRLSEAWANKRNNITNKKLTAAVPAWLKLNKQTGEIEVIEERATIVRQIFEMTRDGMGKRSVVRKLNENKIEPWGRKRKQPANNKNITRGWRDSYIQKILENRAVLGEYQPHTGRGKDRKPVGEPVLDYYPAILSEDLFYQALSARRSRRKAGGRKGLAYSNIFSGFAFCADCGSPMRFLNKGSDPAKGGKYLACDNALRKISCTHNRHYNYKSIEDYVLFGRAPMHDWTKRYISSKNTNNKSNEIDILKTKHDDLTKKINRYMSLFEEDDFDLEETKSRLKELQNARSSVSDKIERLKSANTTFSSQVDFMSRISAVLTKIHTAKNDLELYETRAEIAHHLKYITHSVQFSANNELAIQIFPNIENWPDISNIVEAELKQFRMEKSKLPKAIAKKTFTKNKTDEEIILEDIRMDEAIILSWEQFKNEWMPERPKQPKNALGHYLPYPSAP